MGREPGGGGYTFGVPQANERCTAGGSQHKERTWAWRGLPATQPHPSPPLSQVTPRNQLCPCRMTPLRHPPHPCNSPHPPLPIREKLIGAYIMCVHHPSTRVIDEPRGCTAPFYFSICIIGMLISSRTHTHIHPAARGLEAPAGHRGSRGERPELAVPGRHSPSVEQCSGPCRAICPRARGSHDRWTSRRAREVSSSLGRGGMHAKNHQPLLMPPSSDVWGLIRTAVSWPRTELHKHGHLLTMLLLPERKELGGCSLQLWSPGCTAATGWK